MASSTPSKSATDAAEGLTQLTPPSTLQPSIPTSSNNFEMSDLDDSKRQTGAGTQDLNDIPIPATSPITSDFLATDTSAPTGAENAKPTSEPADPTLTATTTSASKNVASTSSNDPSAAGDSTQAPPALRTRVDSVAIGAADTTPTPTATSASGPVVIITLLLSSTGARHPYKIDEKYLIKRGVNVPETTESGRKDPLSISVYTLKELILREWREEWETKPSSPSSIRLIFFGRLLDDKTALKDCKFAADAGNVVHMTVRPQDVVDEEEQSKGKALRGEGEAGESNAGCKCVIL